MRKLSDEEKRRIRERMIAECTVQTGYAGVKNLERGCSQNFGFREVSGIPFPIPDSTRGVKKCVCFDLTSLAFRHSDWNFDHRLFLPPHGIEDLQFADAAPLQEYLSDMRAAWEGRGLFIFSTDKSGCGKTTLAHLVTKRLYEFGRENGYMRSQDFSWYMLMSEFADRAWKGREGFKQKIDWGENSGESIDIWDARGIIVIDELGREGAADNRKVSEGRLLFESFMRDRAGRPTIVVSHTEPNRVRDVVSPQVVSLMARMAVVEVIGRDRRVVPGSPFYG